MDRITQNLLSDFLQDQQIQSEGVDKDFEKFCNYFVIAAEYPSTFDIQDVSVGDGGDTGIDGIAVVVNGSLVNDEDEVTDLINRNGYLDTTFVFIQAKTSSSFNAAEIGSFFFGVKDFFSSNPSLTRNSFVQAKAKLQDVVYQNSSKMRGNRTPTRKLYFVTTGRWNSEQDLVARVTIGKEDLERTGQFRAIEFHPVDASRIQTMYQSTKGKISKTITFERRVTMPSIGSVDQAYIGVLPVSEYLSLITDDVGNIRKNLFTDNIRDFLGENDVNKEIAQTLKEAETADKFAILNNGITIVSDMITPVGDRFTLENYQIVNGCQTSHVLYNVLHSKTLDEIRGVYVPVKIVATNDENVTNGMIKSTNTQTRVEPEQLIASSPFQRRLEQYYETFRNNPHTKLYYERRLNQYSGVADVEKARIVDIRMQIKVFAAMFLGIPHRAGRYYGDIFDLVGKSMFLENHQPAPYFASSLAHYWLEFFFRNSQLERKYRNYRFHLLNIIRYQLGGSNIPRYFNSQDMDRYAQKIISGFTDQVRALGVCQNATTVLDALAVDFDDGSVLRTQAFTEKITSQLGSKLNR